MHVADQLVLASGMGEEFLRFLQRQARVYPTQELHLVVDNHRTHKHPVVRAWLADNPRIHLHFTPIGGSWMNQVETWFSILQRRAIARGVFRSVPTLVAAIGRFLTGWNNNSRPFAWIKPADVILAKANRLRIPESVH
jgi:transposase